MPNVGKAVSAARVVNKIGGKKICVGPKNNHMQRLIHCFEQAVV